MHFVLLDIILFFLFLIIVFHAAFRGLIEEVSGIAWVVLGFLFAFAYYKEGAIFIRTKILSDVPFVPESIAFLALFFLTFLVVKILCGMLEKLINGVGLGSLDNLLGFVFGIVKGIAIVAFIIFLIRVQPITDGNKILQNSVISKLLVPHIENVDIGKFKN
jgi:membrane protein required for colicin V production